jgi:phospholipase/lecithinase/hemolysin
MHGCASSDTIASADEAYQKLDPEIKEYEPVGDAKIDGLARPFVTGAIQLRKDVEKEFAAIKGSPLAQKMGKYSAEDWQRGYESLSKEEQASVKAYVESAEKADSARLDALLTQVVDLGVAGGKLAIELQDAAQGGAGGAAGIGQSIFNAASGPGGKAAGQVKDSVEFCSAGEALIRRYRESLKRGAEVVRKNIEKAAS